MVPNNWTVTRPTNYHESSRSIWYFAVLFFVGGYIFHEIGRFCEEFAFGWSQRWVDERVESGAREAQGEGFSSASLSVFLSFEIDRGGKRGRGAVESAFITVFDISILTSLAPPLPPSRLQRHLLHHLLLHSSLGVTDIVTLYLAREMWSNK